MTGTAPTSPVLENSGIFLSLKLGAEPAVEIDGNTFDCQLVSDDKDQVTFADVKLGLTKEFALSLKLVQALGAGSLWRLLWENPGAEFAVVYGPNGNAVPSADSPHIIGVVKATGRPTMGVAAGTGKKKGETDYRLEFIDGPELDEGA